MDLKELELFMSDVDQELDLSLNKTEVSYHDNTVTMTHCYHDNTVTMTTLLP